MCAYSSKYRPSFWRKRRGRRRAQAGVVDGGTGRQLWAFRIPFEGASSKVVTPPWFARPAALHVALTNLLVVARRTPAFVSLRRALSVALSFAPVGGVAGQKPVSRHLPPTSLRPLHHRRAPVSMSTPPAANGGAGLSEAAMQMMNILIRLQSADNTDRGTAEQEFNQAKAHKGLCLDALATLAASLDGVDEVVRAQAAVLLRRSASDLWEGADAPTQASVKGQLLMGMRAALRKDLRKKICDTIAVIGGPLVGEEPSQWPELMPALLTLNKSPNAHERENALYVLSQISDYLDGPRFLQPNLGTLKQAFHDGLRDQDVGVQIAALRATCAVVNMIDTQLCPALEDLIPLMLSPVQRTIEQGNDEEARASIELLIEVVETEPKFWKAHLAVVCPLMLQIASRVQQDEDDAQRRTRQIALEFLVSVAEKLPSQCRKMGNFVQSVLPVGLAMMLEKEDDPDWYEQEEEDELADAYTNFDAGQESLDRIAIALGGKSVLPVAEAVIGPFLVNESSWQHRHAALLAISQIGEGCQRQIEEKLGQVIAMAISRFSDRHPRVRWAAINCIGQMCTDFGPRIQEEFHGQIVPSLIAVMDDAANPRVQSHAAAAVINFCDEASPSIIAPYLNSILAKLQTLLQSPLRLTQEQAVTAIAAVADSADSKFTAYYDSFMPVLKQVLSSTSGNKDLRRLRGKVMECISLIGLSVGREKFGRDAADVMSVLVTTSNAQSEDDADDPQTFYLMQAYARICRCLKDEFIQYLPHVMPRLVAAAGQKPEIDVLDALDEDDDGGAEDEEGYETIRVGDKRIGIRTSALEDKATACTMLACFIAELRGGFLPYVEEVVQLMVPLLKFFYHDECRTAAASCMPDLVRCLLDSGNTAQVSALVNFIMPGLLEASRGEPDIDVLVTMVEAILQIADIVPAGLISPELQRSVAETLVLVTVESEQRDAEREEIANHDQWDEEEREEAELDGQKEAELLSRVGDAFGAMLRVHSSSGFMSAFMATYTIDMLPGMQGQGKQAVSPFSVFWAQLEASRPAANRHVALCVFDDVVLFGGPEGAQMIQKVLAPMRMYALDPNPEVRQAACFGLGVCAQVGGDVFMEVGGAACVSPLQQLVTSGDARSDDNEAATDNAVTALLKVLEYQPKCVAGDTGMKLGTMCLAYMPVKADEAEARVVHAALIRGVERGDVRILGENAGNLAKVLSVLADVLGTSSVSEEYQQRGSNVVKAIQTQYPGEILHAAIAGLTEQQKAKLTAAASS
jgi:importin-5